MDLPPQIAADKLVKMANSSKGPDNISVIVARPAGFAAKGATVNLDDTDP
jgi:serine/threonine protein phosphatase PrpC